MSSGIISDSPKHAGARCAVVRHLDERRCDLRLCAEAAFELSHGRLHILLTRSDLGRLLRRVHGHPPDDNRLLGIHVEFGDKELVRLFVRLSEDEEPMQD